MLDQILGWARDGGPIVVLLAVVSVYSVALIIVKLIALRGTLAGAGRRAEAIEAWGAGHPTGARTALGRPRTPADRVLSHAMSALEAGRTQHAVDRELERRGNVELEALRRHIRMLEVIAMVSPLLGLLGTVLGMIESFQELELAGGSANAAVLAGGIWQALLTTAAGLIVAIPAAIAANLFSARVDSVAHQIEDTATALLAADEAREG